MNVLTLSRFPDWLRWILGIAVGIMAIAAGGLAFLHYDRNHQSHAAPSGEPQRPAVSITTVSANTLAVPDFIVRSLGIKTAIAQPATRSQRLAPLSGSLALDTDDLVRVHSRFPGEVVKIGTLPDRDAIVSASGPSAVRPVRFGDRVEEGQLLAVVWSKDLGEKKSELVDALSKLRLDRDTLTRYQNLTESIIPLKQFREAEAAVRSSEIAEARAEATLRAWRLGEDEIQGLVALAEKFGGPDARREWSKDKTWAQVEVRAPLAGTVLEKNTAVGDVVDTASDLFLIADLSRLRVWANVYEEDLPALLALPKPTHWTVRLKADPQARPLPGIIEKVGDLIDPNQHTALVLGRVDNSDGRMRAGQFITATVEEPPPADVVEVPTTALVENGVESVVLVQEDPTRLEYTLRHVDVVARYQDVVHIRAGVNGAEQGHSALGLTPGEQVIVSGAVELRAALAGLLHSE